MTGRDSPVSTVATIPASDFDSRLADGLGLAIGPFKARVRVRDDAITDAIRRLYSDFPLVADDSVFSFHIRLERRRSRFPRARQKVRFTVDGRVPHEDMPAPHSLAVLEWGINLVIALRFHCFLMLHSGVVARKGRALLLPAAPGSGKTTLCAALALHGWRLFSDEFGLLRPRTTDMIPLPRPLALKNESINVIRGIRKDVEIGPEILGTRKGTVAHLKPPGGSVERASELASARWIVYPRWEAGADCRLERVVPHESFMLLATNAFNYEAQGEAGFDTVRRLIDTTQSYRLTYSRIEDAVRALSELHASDGD